MFTPKTRCLYSGTRFMWHFLVLRETDNINQIITIISYFYTALYCNLVICSFEIWTYWAADNITLDHMKQHPLYIPPLCANLVLFAKRVRKNQAKCDTSFRYKKASVKEKFHQFVLGTFSGKHILFVCFTKFLQFFFLVLSKSRYCLSIS
jgi:hypothetical protein